MDTGTILWILGQGIAIVTGGVVAYFLLNNKVADNYNRLSERLVKLETTFELLGENAARLLHSPTNHLKMDELLDKYIDRHYEMTPKEWDDLRAKCEEVVEDPSHSKDERLMAAILGAVCCHKTMMPPEKVKKPKL